ncbi:MAG TPA: hypothetical protein EYN17_00535, partial [Candidatus Poseidoniales archaeon]|nr:hypothetical protein [Candidatus Poseidoniales archaeon]
MLDIKMFRDHADIVRADHDKRGIAHDNIDEVIRLDDAWKKARYDADQLRRSRNQAARGIAEAKKSGNDEEADKILAQVATLGAQIDELGVESDNLIKTRDTLRMKIPNILHASVPIGDDEGGNTEHSKHGEKQKFS